MEMKKRIGIVLLCVILASVMALSLVACGKTEEPQESIIGSWVGYMQGHDKAQYYFECKKWTAADGETAIHVYNYRAYIPNHEYISTDKTILYESYGLLGSAQTTEQQDIYRLAFNFGHNNGSQQIYKATVSNDRMTVELDDITYIFKKTNLTKEEWQAVAFKQKVTLDGEPIVDDNNDYIFIPYFYEK